MTYKQLAKAIRAQQAEYNAVTTKLYTDLETTKQKCKHDHVVVVCSENTGSYSWDYDDAYPEYRQCLICGFMESGSRKEGFKTLLKPFKRLELGYPHSTKTQYRNSPLNQCLTTPLKDLLAWVEKNGYNL